MQTQNGPRVGVILSGCGVFDGSEIHEAVLCLLSLDEAGAGYHCLAPNKPLDVIDHTTKRPAGEQRNVLLEAARIARGDIQDVADVNGADFDALLLPGGFGAAKNLCDFAAAGPDCEPDVEVARVLQEAQDAGRPLGFACIAPVLAARVFGRSIAPTLTIGEHGEAAKALEAMGAKHFACAVDDIVVDEANRIVTTPAYMYAAPIGRVHAGIRAMVGKVLAMVREPAAA